MDASSYLTTYFYNIIIYLLLFKLLLYYSGFFTYILCVFFTIQTFLFLSKFCSYSLLLIFSLIVNLCSKCGYIIIVFLSIVMTANMGIVSFEQAVLTRT